MGKSKKKPEDYAGALAGLISPGRDPTPGAGRPDPEGEPATPGEILAQALEDVYGVERNDAKLALFQLLLLKRLSELSTGGALDSLFGASFDGFYMMYVDAINMCGRMKEVLEANGIGFDPRDGGDEEEDEDDQGD